jgi:hypothetical protein
MNKTFSVALALIAGILGSLLTRYVAPPAAFAQTQAPITKEIRAESFTLVDPSDRAVGTFTSEPAVPPAWTQSGPNAVPKRSMLIVLRDANGREIWSAGATSIRPLSQR